MPLQFSMTAAPLDDAAIRAIVREAEMSMADGVDAKHMLVNATLAHFATGLAEQIEALIHGTVSMAQMMGESDADIAKTLGSEIDALAPGREDIVNIVLTPLYPIADVVEHAAARSYQAAGAFVALYAPAESDRGKWLAQFGIVAKHAKGIMGGAANPAPAAPPAAPAAAAPTAGGTEPGNMRGPLLLFAEAMDIDDKALCTRLGVSQGTWRNWKAGKASKVRLSIDQMRVFVAEIDARNAKLRQVADVFAQAVGK